MPDYVEGNRLTLLRNGEQYFPALVAAIDAAQDRSVPRDLHLRRRRDRQPGRRRARARSRARRRHAPADRRLRREGFRAALPAHARRGGRRGARVPPAGESLAVLEAAQAPAPHAPQARVRRRPPSRSSAASTSSTTSTRRTIAAALRLRGAHRGPARRAGARRGGAALVARRLGHARPALAGLRAARRATHAPSRRRAAAPEPAQAAGSGQRAALVVRDSLRHRRDIENAYLEQIDAARSEVIVANAYFFPDAALPARADAGGAARVAVTLLLQGKSEHPLLYYASRALYRSAAGRRRAHPRVLPQRTARQGRGLRRLRGDRRLFEHRPLQPGPRARGQRVRRRQGLCRGAAAEPARRDRERKRARCRRTTGSGFASA